MDPASTEDPLDPFGDAPLPSGDGADAPDASDAPAEPVGRRWSLRPSPITIRRVLFGMGAGALVALVLPAWIVFPYYRDDRALDRIVRIVALDWRDFGEARARSRLEYELDDAGIGLWVRDEDCTLATEGPARRVGCRWSVPVVVPGVEVVVPLSFESVVAIGPDGNLH